MDRRQILYASVVAGVTVGTRSLRSEVPADGSCSPPNMYGFQQCVAGIQTSKLGVTAYQRATEWCWAACISGVFAYYGHDISQPRIVEEAYGGIVNLPGSPQAIL